VGLRDAAGPRHLAHVRSLPRGRLPQLWLGDQWYARSCWRFLIRRTVNSAAQLPLGAHFGVRGACRVVLSVKRVAHGLGVVYAGLPGPCIWVLALLSGFPGVVLILCLSLSHLQN